MAQLQQYLPALREITLVRLLKQVAQVYQSICFERLLQLAPFTDSFTLERVIVDCVRHNDMQVCTLYFSKASLRLIKIFVLITILKLTYNISVFDIFYCNYSSIFPFTR